MFKAGDKVICVTTYDNFGALCKGQVYTVKEMAGDKAITLEEFPGRGFIAAYFQLVCLPETPATPKNKKIKLIYVAGPYRSATREGVRRNIETAMQVAMYVAKAGYMPVVPHACTQYFDWDYPKLQPDSFWLDGTMEMLDRCDAIIMCPGWEHSSGSKAEHEHAEKTGKKVCYSTAALAALFSEDKAQCRT